MNSKKGFTLLEVAAALVIIAIALLAMGKMQTRSLDAAEHAGRVATALRLAQDVIEQMRAHGIDSWQSSTGDQVCPGGTAQNSVSCPANLDPEGRTGRYTRSWVVNSNNSGNWLGVVGSGMEGCEVREVNVTVSWGAMGPGKRVVQRALLTTCE